MARQIAMDFPNPYVHVIGFKLELETRGDGGARTERSTRYLADLTGGLHQTADTVSELAGALTKVLGCALIGRIGELGRKTG